MSLVKLGWLTSVHLGKNGPCREDSRKIGHTRNINIEICSQYITKPYIKSFNSVCSELCRRIIPRWAQKHKSSHHGGN